MLLNELFDFLPKSNKPASYGKSEGKYPFFNSSNIIDKFVDDPDYSGEFLIIGDGGTGNCKYYNGKFSATDHTYLLKPKNNTNCKLVKYFLEKDNYKILNDGFKGVGIKNVSKSYIQNIEFKKNNKYTDQFILDVLDSINILLQENENQLVLLDELIKSRFIEMFGNLKDTVRLGDCCDVHARIGWQALTTKEHRPTGDYMLITGTDFKDNEIDYSTCVYVEKDRYEMDPHIILKNDDVLITKDGTIGKVAIVHSLPKPATLNGGVFVVRPDERFNKEYIAYVFKGPLFEEYVEKSKTGATIKHLNQKHLVEFNIPVPSIDKQVEFAKFAQQIDKSKFINYSRYFLWEFLTLFSSTIAYSSVVSILA